MNNAIFRHMVFATYITFLFALVVFVPGIALGQATNSGTIVGTVTDPSGALIQGAVITITDPATKSTRTTISNRQGQYIVPDIPPGVYDVKTAKTGFSTDLISALAVSVGSQTTANFQLSVGADSTIVEVTASNADLQTMNASTGTTVDPALVNSLPTIGREVSSFITLQPGVSPGGNVAGTTTDQGTFMLDGGNNTFDMDGTGATYTTAFAPIVGTMPMPQDSIEEFKVSTTGQTADFNNSAGSQTQAVTKRGHDRWTGTAYEYYLNNSFNANSWQNNFQNTTTTSYTPKTSYHFSRFGVAAGGPVLPKLYGGKTYLFAMYEGFRYPQASIYERTVPSYQYLQQGQLTFGTKTYTAAQLTAADPRGIGFNPTLQNFYNTDLPVAPASNNGSVGATGITYAGTFDQSCGSLSTSYCDGKNIIGYKAAVLTPEKTDFFVARADHDFGPKWHISASYRFYEFTSVTSNQVDIGGGLPGDKVGVPTAVAPRPQEPWYLVTGVTTNISNTLTNDFHYSFLRNYWNWKDANAPAQVAGAGGAIEPLGENTTTVLSPYNVNAQSIRTRTWDGKDNFFSDNLTKLKGDHLIQVGGQFQHNSYFFSRTDNGSSINFTPTYQIGDTGGGGNIAYTGLTSVGAGTAAYARILDTYYGLVTDTQVANTYSNTANGLSLNAPLTPVTGHASNPFYNLYVTDTWRTTSALTLNVGLSYAVEMPPQDRNGNESLLTDASGNPLSTMDFLNQRKAAALSGQIYNPEIGWAEIHNVAGNRKYPYNPFYGGVSPHFSVVWAPKFTNGGLNKLFGAGGTAIRAGYSRIYGRVNGDAEILPLLAAPGLIVGTQCKYAQSPTAGTGVCTQTNYTDATAYRFGKTSQGEDGLTPVLASANVTSTLPQPYHPGFDGPGIASSSGVDVSLRPNDVDSFNLSIQRQINRKMLLEVGYIGRLVHHEFNQVNPNSVPYMLTLGGQSFQSAYLAIETAFGCTTSASLCSVTTAKAGTKSTSVNPVVPPQPFFEAALGGATSPYCSAYSSCTAAVVAKQASNFGAQKVFSLWQALDNSVNGSGGVGFTFARSLMGTATSNTTFGSAGQVVSGMNQDVSNGYSNYNGGYVSFKTSGWRGLTLQENLTYSKALGIQPGNQSASGATDVDNYNQAEQYGRQAFDQRIIFNTFIVYQTPWYKQQRGIVGRVAGGWTFSPVLTAATGAPLGCTTNNSGQSFGGNDGANLTDTESCVFVTGYSSGYHTHRGIVGGTDAYGIAVGTAVHAGGTSAAVNMFTDPVAVFDSVRPLILGLDSDSGGAGRINGLPNLNLDLSVKKQLVVYERYSLELTGVCTNVLNQLEFANPSLNLQSSSAWGVTKTQGNSPRQLQAGVRAYF